MNIYYLIYINPRFLLIVIPEPSQNSDKWTQMPLIEQYIKELNFSEKSSLTDFKICFSNEFENSIDKLLQILNKIYVRLLMTKIDFFGGVNEIGGNKILVKESEGSFFFDFGMGFSRANDYLSEFLQPRKTNGIIDFVELGFLPYIKGIYREDYLNHVGLEHQEEPAVDGVLISHSHVDHVSYIHHLREDIPIYLNEESFLILKALEDTGATTFSEYLHLKKTFYITPNKKKDGYIRPKLTADRDIRIIEPYKKFEIGNFEIKSAPVDHSLPGATGYIAENDEDTIVYTGDLRFHGRQPELTKKFVQEAKKSKPSVMISEGTRINKTENITEFEIEERIVKEYPKL